MQPFYQNIHLNLKLILFGKSKHQYTRQNKLYLHGYRNTWISFNSHKNPIFQYMDMYAFCVMLHNAADPIA